MKSPRVFLEGGIHQRIELEIAAAKPLEVQSQIKEIGMIATSIIEKERWSFTGGNITVVVDNLPYIGTFVEIEGQNTDAVSKTRTMLNIDEMEVITANYTELLELRLKELNIPIKPCLIASFRD